MPNTEPKILLWDVETSHNVVAAFRLDQNYIHPENILVERHLVCAAWKWFGESQIHVSSLIDDLDKFVADPHDDIVVCKKLHEVLSQADVIVAHNGDKFDIKFVETRMLINGLPPLPPIAKVDTLKVAKKRFMFNANKLDYLGKVLGVGRKRKTRANLWLDVLNGDPKAVADMATYNKGDIVLLEKVFLKLRPYISNVALHQHAKNGECPRCGSSKLQSRGVHKTVSRVYQRFHCQGCGGWSRKLKSEPSESDLRVV